MASSARGGGLERTACFILARNLYRPRRAGSPPHAHLIADGSDAMRAAPALGAGIVQAGLGGTATLLTSGSLSMALETYGPPALLRSRASITGGCCAASSLLNAADYYERYIGRLRYSDLGTFRDSIKVRASKSPRPEDHATSQSATTSAALNRTTASGSRPGARRISAAPRPSKPVSQKALSAIALVATVVSRLGPVNLKPRRSA